MVRRPSIRCSRRFAVAAIAIASLAPSFRTLVAEEASAVKSKSAVGVPTQLLQVVLPGSELEAKPIEDRKTPVVVRVIAAYRHGSDYRYDLEFYGLEPGRYDLKDYLQRKDRSSLDAVPALPVEIETRLPPGQLIPSAVQPSRLPAIGGYRAAMYGLLGLWLAGILWLILGGGRRRQAATTEAAQEASPAELLRPLVTDAVAGKLSPARQAELERLLLSYWRRRLRLESADPVVALAAIRNHAVAGELLRQVEDWLHRPGGAGEVDIAAVLAPYQNLPDVIDAEDHPPVAEEPLPVSAARGG